MKKNITIEERFKDFKGEYEPLEIDWGKPQGEEKIQLYTFADYMADDSRVSPAERERINAEIELIGKQIKDVEEVSQQNQISRTHVTRALDESLLQYDDLYKKLAK